MTIKGMADVKRLRILGRVGLGVTIPVIDKKTGQQVIKNGEPQTTPKATDHFVVPEEVAAIAEVGPHPKQLSIHFEMDRLEDVFPTGLMQFRGNGDLICMGDGEMVTFRRHIHEDHSTTAVIYDRVGHWPEIEGLGLLNGSKGWPDVKDGYGTVERIGNTVRCLGMNCPRYTQLFCKPTGKLRFCIEGIQRQGYYQMTVHLNPMRELLTQIEDGRQWIRNRTGIPTIVYPARWLLTLTGPTDRWMNVRRGGKIEQMHIENIYTPELELDPKSMAEIESGLVQFRAGPAITEEDVWGAAPELDKTLLEREPYVETSNGEDEDLPF